MNSEKLSNEAENPALNKGDAISRYLIYADDFITWNKEIGDWNHNDEFTGTFFDAHEYARKKYGKKYDIHNGL